MTELEVVKDKLERIEALIQRQSYEIEGIRSILVLKPLIKSIQANGELYEDLANSEAKDALENIEHEIIARACRNGVCED